LVFLLYALAVVDDIYHKLSPFGQLHVFYHDCDFTVSGGKLYGVAIEIEQHLLKPLHVRLDPVLVERVFAFETLVQNPDFNLLEGNLVLENLKQMGDGFFEVELFVVLFEILLIFIHNGVIQNVMHKEVDELSRRRDLLAAEAHVGTHLD